MGFDAQTGCKSDHNISVGAGDRGVVVVAGALGEAVVYYHMAVGEGIDFGYLMTHYQHRTILGYARQYLIKLLLEMAVEIAQRLVENQHIGPSHNCTPQQGSLQLAARQTTYWARSKITKLDRAECFVYLAPLLLFIKVFLFLKVPMQPLPQP